MMNLWSKNLLLKKLDPYKKNQVLLEKSTAGTFSVTLETGVYDIWCVGGGGGGSNGAGGAGAGIHARAKLLKGTYSCVVGAAGAGASAYVRNNNGSHHARLPPTAEPEEMGVVTVAVEARPERLVTHLNMSTLF